jgi:hypothetical protein
MRTIRQLECAIVKGNIKKAPAITRKCLLEGLRPQAIIKDGILKGLDTVGQKWKTYEYFIPNVLVSAMATKLCLEALHPALKAGADRPIAKALAGTVHGDVHDIGKNIVVMFLEASGFQVIDLGIDVAPEKKDENPGRRGPDHARVRAPDRGGRVRSRCRRRGPASPGAVEPLSGRAPPARRLPCVRRNDPATGTTTCWRGSWTRSVKR